MEQDTTVMQRVYQELVLLAGEQRQEDPASRHTRKYTRIFTQAGANYFISIELASAPCGAYQDCR